MFAKWFPLHACPTLARGCVAGFVTGGGVVGVYPVLMQVRVDAQGINVIEE